MIDDHLDLSAAAVRPRLANPDRPGPRPRLQAQRGECACQALRHRAAPLSRRHEDASATFPSGRPSMPRRLPIRCRGGAGAAD